MKKMLVGIVLAVLVVTPLLVYAIHFFRYPLSNKTETWGQFGDYLNGTSMPLIALIGVLVTFLLGIISEKRNKANIEIEQLKQRPLLHIGYFDGEDHLRIFMKNKGSGPLIINGYRLMSLNSKQEIPSIFDCLPGITTDFNNYTGNQENTVLSANEEYELFLYQRDKGDNPQEFSSNRDKIRKSLAQFKIVVDYKDVYDNSMPTYERSLKWFGRHFASMPQ
jgi:hypothetical protein